MKLLIIISILFGVFVNYSIQLNVPTKTSITSECSNCLILTKILFLKNDIKLPIKKDFCTSTNICPNISINDCQIVEALKNNNDIVNVKIRSKKVLEEYLDTSIELCKENPNINIFKFNKFDTSNTTTPSYGLCVKCELLSTVLKIFNDALFGGPIENAIRNAFYKVCTQLGAFIESFCEFLFSDNGVDVLFQALRDSLGSFYQIIGVQDMGCPKFNDLESTCFSPL
ncbi:Hypothetical protein SRAE_X000108500 [Strongyloides ratti]|uniref:Saposin B domain and Saposin-like domain-containing protein n=1 Tax=Strongyloides ratti TaxID=34506 RepID=A0A090KTZ9_STRRB|nr:Hypothetical protein SRAE_X000108500 [Strongyloides ratti]CEF59335.1 Hypothetical protein SRAE_X000108500 [Strongyloides ratti]